MVWASDGRARVDRRHPDAFAICDFCYCQTNRSRLFPDRQYMGAQVRATGFLVCKECLDRPQPQQKAIILPPDPLPVDNPRVDIAPNGNQGFTQYMLTLQGLTVTGAYGAIGQFSIGYSAIGVGFTVEEQNYPTDQGNVLQALAAVSGIATPTPLSFYGTTIAATNTVQTIVPANASRSWIALYNPGGAQCAFSLGTASWGSLTNLITGPGECWFWATAQDNGTVSTNAITVLSLAAGAPVWAWDH